MSNCLQFVNAKLISFNNVANNNNDGVGNESKLLRCKVLTLIIMGLVEGVQGAGASVEGVRLFPMINTGRYPTVSAN